MRLELVALFLGTLTVTSYRPVREQTDSTPFHTSTGERVAPGGVAVSRDLLCGACRKLHRRCEHPEYPKKLHYGDALYINGYGFKYINDCMGIYTSYKVRGKIKRKIITNQIDIFVRTYKEEKSVNIKHLEVWKVKEKLSDGR